jgi:hypothetical protein
MNRLMLMKLPRHRCRVNRLLSKESCQSSCLLTLVRPRAAWASSAPSLERQGRSCSAGLVEGTRFPLGITPSGCSTKRLFWVR